MVINLPGRMKTAPIHQRGHRRGGAQQGQRQGETVAAADALQYGSGRFIIHESKQIVGIDPVLYPKRVVLVVGLSVSRCEDPQIGYAAGASLASRQIKKLVDKAVEPRIGVHV